MMNHKKKVETLIEQIKNVRKTNNVNWMRILELAIEYAPAKEMYKILKNVQDCDKSINLLFDDVVEQIASKHGAE